MKQFLKDIIIEAGHMALQYRSRLSELVVEMKSKNEVVSEADRAVETFLRCEINKRYPDHGILGEEHGEQPGNEYRWVIDPIDGTTSFLHNQPFFCVSIALEKAGQTILGAVNAPVLGELFEARLGGGSTCNDRPIRVSDQPQLADSVLVTGFAALRREQQQVILDTFSSVMRRVWSVRVLGSAALDLCYVACGWMDGFWERNLNNYDVAAGLLIVSEAAGQCSDYAGSTTNMPNEILATNSFIHDQMIDVLR